MKQIREFEIKKAKEIEVFLTDLAIEQVKYNFNRTSSSILARIRGKITQSPYDFMSKMMGKDKAIAQVSAKFIHELKKDLEKGEDYQFRNLEIKDKLAKNEVLEIRLINKILICKVFI